MKHKISLRYFCWISEGIQHLQSDLPMPCSSPVLTFEVWTALIWRSSAALIILKSKRKHPRDDNLSEERRFPSQSAFLFCVYIQPPSHPLWGWQAGERGRKISKSIKWSCQLFHNRKVFTMHNSIRNSAEATNYRNRAILLLLLSSWEAGRNDLFERRMPDRFASSRARVCPLWELKG